MIGNARRIFRVQYSDSGTFRVSWKVLCRNEFLVFLGSAHFSMSNKNEKFPKNFQ